jgi:hypothetical protein
MKQLPSTLPSCRLCCSSLDNLHFPSTRLISVPVCSSLLDMQYNRNLMIIISTFELKKTPSRFVTTGIYRYIGRYRYMSGSCTMEVPSLGDWGSCSYPVSTKKTSTCSSRFAGADYVKFVLNVFVQTEKWTENVNQTFSCLKSFI